MKEELIKVLNYKLDDINSDIESLIDLNNKIDEENEKSGFLAALLGVFNGNDDYMNFAKIEKGDFERALDIVGEEVRNVLSTDSCNYDGLVYLIDGINEGISLTLTDEQKNGIKYFIDALGEKKKEFDSAVEGYNLIKTRYDVSDISELNGKKDEYTKVISDVNENNYVKNIDLLKEAIGFSNLSSDDTINLLTYVLEYNSDLYKEGKEVVNNEVAQEKEEPEETNEFHFNDIDNDKLFDLPNITFDEDTYKEDNDIEDKNEVVPDYQEYTPSDISNTDTELDKEEETYIPAVEESEVPEEETHEEEKEEESADEYVPAVENNEEPIEEETVTEEPATQEVEEKKEEPVIDSDFSDVIDEKEDYDNTPVAEEEKISTRELQKLFGKYGIEDNAVLNELIGGNVNEYQNMLDFMKDSDILESIKNNKELLIEILLYSNTEVVEKVLKIIKNDLSVDDEDYAITSKIAVNTIPSIFVKDGGNYDNFVNNIELFKKLELNLINLFDFSKEIFVADNEKIKENLDVVKKYDFEINYKNAKYLLLIPNIADKLDYYIESVYEDKLKNETFDGINYIKDFAAKLNVVTDETIKRLRYSSENGKKVFGSKPGSLSGEITNLKVKALDISSDYMNKFFNNEFANLTGEETREFIKLIHNSSNVGDYSDELDKLKGYKDGLRYNIDGIKVSYNKVVRNYSILRSYGIDSKKALQFAVCYNLVITKDEYDKLNDLLDKIGGNV